MKSILLAALVLAPAATHAAPALEAWNCRTASGPQRWEVQGSELVTDMTGLPPAMTRLPIVRNSDDTVMAVSEEYAGRRYEVVLIDKRKPALKVITLGVETAPLSDSGTCISGFARPAARMPEPVAALPGRPVAAPPAMVATVRPQVRSLLKQAENLAGQGYYRPAMVKVRETDAIDRKTPDELGLIAQMRHYIVAKSGGKGLQ